MSGIKCFWVYFNKQFLRQPGIIFSDEKKNQKKKLRPRYNLEELNSSEQSSVSQRLPQGPQCAQQWAGNASVRTNARAPVMPVRAKPLRAQVNLIFAVPVRGLRATFSWFRTPDVPLKRHLAQCSVRFSRSVMSDSLQPHEPQHARPPCPSPTAGVHPNPCPLSR